MSSTTINATRPTAKIRVLIVDDSAFARKVIRETLTADRRIECLGHAADGLEALEKIAELKPDVVTMDLMMPELDGVGVLQALRHLPDPPHVVVVTTQDDNTALAIAALQEGAFDVVVKPTTVATDRLYDMGRELLDKVILAGQARSADRVTVAKVATAEPRALAAANASDLRVIVVGASTGGPRAVTLLLQSLPATLPVPMAIVVHMPEGFTAGFAERLDRQSALHVFEARPGPIKAGQVAIARAGIHLRIVRNGNQCELAVDMHPADSAHRPSVDVLLASAAQAFGRSVLAVVMTGMGADGVEGARALHAAGARVVVEAESTCVVYGMPRAIAEAGLADAVVPLGDMGAEIIRGLVRR